MPAASASAKKQKHILPKAEPPGSDIASRYAGSSSSTSALHGSVVYHVDMSVPTVWRISGDSRQQATLKPGPLGFAVATWGAQERSTEIPNLVLEKRAKHPAKEAASCEEESWQQSQGQGQGQEQGCLQESCDCFAGCRGHDLELAEESCAKILEGQDEATVKSWALDELNKQKNV